MRWPTAALLLTSVAVSACGSGHDQPAGRIAGRTLSIYVGVPQQGASAAAGASIVNGARLALAAIHARIGRYRVVLKQLNETTPTRGGWDPGQTSDDVRDVVADPTTIGYLGDPDSGASAITIPVLNRVGIAQVSPTATAVGLTSAGSGAAPGEPDKYYPTGARNFVRVAPSDAVQAAVQVSLQRQAGCRSTYVVDDGEVDGEDMTTSFELAARAAGLQVVGTQQYDPRATDYRALAASIANAGADCVLIAAIADSNAVAITSQLAAGPHAVRLFGSAGLADSTYARGLPPALNRRIVITSPGLGASAYPADGQAVLAAYARRYGRPEPQAILGYEAMSLLLSAITSATDHGHAVAERSKVVRALLETRARRSVLGTYAIDSDGDTTSGRFGVWTISSGQLRFVAAVDG